MKFTCPTDRRGNNDLVGCGTEFEAEPDSEGFVDCPNCGLFFQPIPIRPEDAAEAILRDERAEAKDAAARLQFPDPGPRQILFILKEREGDHNVITVATGREQAKRNVRGLGALSGNPDWWVVTPLTKPGEKISAAGHVMVLSDPVWRERLTDAIWFAMPERISREDATAGADAVIAQLAGKGGVHS